MSEVQDSKETPQNFLIRVLDLRQKILFASQEAESSLKYDPILVQNMFLHTVLTGLQNDYIRGDLKPYLQQTDDSHLFVFFMVDIQDYQWIYSLAWKKALVRGATPQTKKQYLFSKKCFSCDLSGVTFTKDGGKIFCTYRCFQSIFQRSDSENRLSQRQHVSETTGRFIGRFMEADRMEHWQHTNMDSINVMCAEIQTLSGDCEQSWYLQSHYSREIMFRVRNQTAMTPNSDLRNEVTPDLQHSDHFWWLLAVFVIVLLIIILICLKRKRIFRCFQRLIFQRDSDDSENRDPESAVQMI
ncbi:hypothetical protein ROHU_030878 [Labeo rohita]|uniref:Uncharacterized protein n=1 Tax=Labeo rohita TaxID=84645 RepID=A0A498LQ54_LABRO|nr:hypothetical protein ROHU_030878 [Labeo rohita]